MDEFDNLSDLGFAPMCGQGVAGPAYYENERKRKIKAYEKIAERHGGASKVIVGSIVDFRENYAENRFYATVETPVEEEDFSGVRKTEAFIEVADAVGVVAMTDNLYCGRVVVIDRRTGKITEATSCSF